jgi:iron complex outermembrane receptor protein
VDQGVPTDSPVYRGEPGSLGPDIGHASEGFNLQFANKSLVLIDGRAVYTPLFGGVYWDTQDVSLEDIVRIEVIRGPGGTVWGANAVNSVINIITKKPKLRKAS